MAKPPLSFKNLGHTKTASSFYPVNDGPKVSSTEGILQASKTINELLKDGGCESDWLKSYIHVRLITNEELFPFSQEEWDASFDNPSIAESLINWV